MGQHGIVINTSPRIRAGWREKECIYATLWRETRPQSLLGKKAAAQEMWCNWDATVPLDLFTPQLAKVVFFSALCGFQGPVSRYVDMAGCNISDCARHSMCQVQSVLSEHITIHSHFNKSVPHISVYSPLYIFSNSVHTTMSVPAVL